MGRVFRPTYTVPLKPTHTIVTRDGARYAVVKGRECPIIVGRDGSDRVQVESENYAVEYMDAAGRQVRKGAGRDKKAAQQVLAKLERDVERVRSGLAQPSDELGSRPLEMLLDEYLAVVAAKGGGAGHLALGRQRLEDTLAGCGWVLWRDVTADGFTSWCGRRKVSAATKNGYRRYAVGFVSWLAERMAVVSPLGGKKVPRWKESDRKRSTYALSDAEFSALVASAAGSRPRRRGEFAGESRACFYLTAAYTGFRAGELAALTRKAFHLTGPAPTVILAGKHTKNGADAVQPIPPDVAARLTAWLKTAPATGPVWPGKWCANRKQAEWLATDLKRAGLPTHDAHGRRINFHGLRRRYITTVIEAGASARDAMQLARHSDPKLTLQVYAATKDAAGFADLMGRLPKVR